MAKVGYAHPSLMKRQVQFLERQLDKERAVEAAVEDAKAHNAHVDVKVREHPTNAHYFAKVSEEVPEGSVLRAQQLHEERRSKVRYSLVNMHRVAKHFPFAVPSASASTGKLPRISNAT